MISSKVTTILLDGWIFPVGGVALGRICAQPAEQACFYENKTKFPPEYVNLDFTRGGREYRESLFQRRFPVFFALCQHEFLSVLGDLPF